MAKNGLASNTEYAGNDILNIVFLIVLFRDCWLKLALSGVSSAKTDAGLAINVKKDTLGMKRQ